VFARHMPPGVVYPDVYGYKMNGEPPLLGTTRILE
jgi:hypothetical protein